MTTVEQPQPVAVRREKAWPAELLRGKYLSLTTYRRDGTPVATPVWFVEDRGVLYVVTGADSYKARRIRRNRTVAVAACNARGTLRGEAVPARAELLPDVGREHVDRLMSRKYRLDRILVLPADRLVMRLRGHGAQASGDEAYLAIMRG